jgi:hypothetical protein
MGKLDNLPDLDDLIYNLFNRKQLDIEVYRKKSAWKGIGPAAAALALIGSLVLIGHKQEYQPEIREHQQYSSESSFDLGKAMENLSNSYLGRLDRDFLSIQKMHEESAPKKLEASQVSAYQHEIRCLKVIKQNYAILHNKAGEKKCTSLLNRMNEYLSAQVGKNEQTR